MDLNDISGAIVDAAVSVHRELGPGLLESVYELALAYELECRGFEVLRQVPVNVRYRDVELGEGFKIDLLVNGLVIVELKSVERTLPVHAKQLLTYLRLSDRKLGLLLNFGAPLMKDGIQRIIN